MRVNRRKTIALRSPSSTSTLPGRKAGGVITYHAIPPSTFSTPSLQLLIYATSNDRYPGAPGTSLHRAKVEAARAIAASKREVQKELDRREELKRLGILGVGKKRVAGGAAAAAAAAAAVNGHTSSASNGGTSRYNTPPATERIRRGQAASSNQHQPPTSTSSSSSTASTRQPRSIERSIANSIDHGSLPIPFNAALARPGSPLLTSSGRLRRPASSSRGASPMPLTSQAAAHTNGTSHNRIRSPIANSVELGAVSSPMRGGGAGVTTAVAA
ncbi:hypothetical protein CBS101457_001804 [Exobasidium rhododendri]|nr:hypothetical protein CBS101457_001804 [Exobasidium rhododendri]